MWLSSKLELRCRSLPGCHIDYGDEAAQMIHVQEFVRVSPRLSRPPDVRLMGATLSCSYFVRDDAGLDGGIGAPRPRRANSPSNTELNLRKP